MTADEWAKALRWHAHTVRNATAIRDNAIVGMRSEGASLRAIAEAAGLSHTAIANIVERAGH